MITKEQMADQVLAACPTFVPAWREFCAEWEDEPGEKPIYVALGDLARHLLALAKAGKTEEFPAVFEVVERWHIEGDAFVKEAATVGLLEGLQSDAGHQDAEFQSVETWMQPETKRWWDKLSRFWAGDARALLDD